MSVDKADEESGTRGRLHANVTLSTRCGQARHDVIYRVTVWGHVFRIFTPCQQMPRGLTKMMQRNCESLLIPIRMVLQEISLSTLILDSCDEVNGIANAIMDPWGELERFISDTHKNKRKLADTVLPNVDESTIVQAIRKYDNAQCWAAAVLASTQDGGSRRLLNALRSIDRLSQPVTRAIYLQKISESRNRNCIRCAQESLLDCTLAHPVRDAMARRLARVEEDFPIDSILCEVTESGERPYVVPWSELRILTNCRTPVVTKVMVSPAP